MTFKDGVWVALAREDGKSTAEPFLVGSLPALAKNAKDLQPKDIKLIIDDTMICDHSDDDDDVQPLRDDPALDDPDSDDDDARRGTLLLADALADAFAARDRRAPRGSIDLTRVARPFCAWLCDKATVSSEAARAAAGMHTAHTC